MKTKTVFLSIGFVLGAVVGLFGGWRFRTSYIPSYPVCHQCVEVDPIHNGFSMDSLDKAGMILKQEESKNLKEWFFRNKTSICK